MNTGFTKGQAEALLGKTFESTVALPNVRKGARGLVIAIEHVDRSWQVVIQWQINARDRGRHGQIGWFIQDELQWCLREVETSARTVTA